MLRDQRDTYQRAVLGEAVVPYSLLLEEQSLASRRCCLIFLSQEMRCRVCSSRSVWLCIRTCSHVHKECR